jgi:hypothetical protein
MEGVGIGEGLNGDWVLGREIEGFLVQFLTKLLSIFIVAVSL